MTCQQHAHKSDTNIATSRPLALLVASLTNRAAAMSAAEGKGTFAVKVGLAQMLKGGVIMDVVNEEQARIAEEAGAVAGA